MKLFCPGPARYIASYLSNVLMHVHSYSMYSVCLYAFCVYFPARTILFLTMHGYSCNQILEILSHAPFPGYPRSMDVIGETSLLVTSEAKNFYCINYGLNVHVPPGSLPAGVEECRVDIRVGLTGQFEFQKSSQLVSAVYWLSSPVKFSKQLTVEIQHCATESPSSGLSFVIAKSSQEKLPYKFKALHGGVFTPHSSYGSITLSQFSLLGIIASRLLRKRYYAQVFYEQRTSSWIATFVITRNLKACISVSIAIVFQH